jgi:hypothetical protein
MITALKNKLKDRFFTIYTHQYKRLKKRKPISNNSDTSTLVGFIYTAEVANYQKTAAVLRAVEKLKRNNKQVKILCYLPNKHMPADRSINSFTRDDISFFGKSKKDALTNFLQTPFTYLYHLDVVTEPILNYIIAKSTAKYKIGNFIAGRTYLFDILYKGIAEPDENFTFDEVIEKILGCTNMLKL